MNTFHLDIITPTNTHTFKDVSYVRIPGIDGLLGIEANHANAIIALNIGEIKIEINNKTLYFSTSGGFTDIQSKGVQLLLETFEESKIIDKSRAEKSLQKAEQRLKDKSQNFERANKSLQRAKNRISVFNKQ
jgi:F-type H+-transporting ATPase subunit epsilon